MPKTTATPQPRLLPFKIGADPEILIFYGEKHINAGQAIPRFFEGKFTRSPHGMGYNIGEHGDFGWDGSAPSGEIRPKESNDINVMTNNIGQLFKAAHETMPLFDFSTLSIGRPIGGHFHVDAPPEFMKNEKIQAKVRKIIAAFLLPILASEHKLSSTQRTKGSGYGDISDIRVHDEFKTFELRGPSSEWLISEKICRSSLAYIAVVWNEIRKNHITLSKSDVMFKSIYQAKAMQDMIIADYKPLATLMTGIIAKEIKKFELYAMYKEEIDFILDPKAVYKEKEAAGWNINNGWKLQGTKNPTKKDLNAKNKVKEAVKGINMEMLTNTFSISYNDDYNIALFAGSIAERIAALNWNLKNEYFLFGLKKGTEGFLAAKAIQFINSDGAKICYTIPNNISKDDSSKALKNIATKIKGSISSSIKINPKTGKAFSGVSNTILIGIPYDIRANEETKPLIDLMWNIENGKTLQQPIANFETKVISMKDVKPSPEEIIATVVSAQGNLSAEAQAIAQETINEDYQQVEERVIPPTSSEDSDDNDDDDEVVCENCDLHGHTSENCDE